MNIGSLSLAGKCFTLASIPALLFVASCSNKQNHASASMPPATAPSIFPDGMQATPTSSSSTDVNAGIFANNDLIQAPEKSKPKPFSLRSNETMVSYKVQKGDNLSRIASRYGTSVKRIQLANNLTGTTILAGKTYKVPATRQPSAAELKASTSVASTSKISSPPSPPAAASANSGTGSTSSFGSFNSSSSGQSYNPPSPSSFSGSSSGGYTPPRPTTSDSASSGAPPTFAPRDFSSFGMDSSSGSGSSTNSEEKTSSSASGNSSGSGFPSTFGPGSSF